MEEINIYVKVLEKINSGIIISKNGKDIFYINNEAKKILDFENDEDITIKKLPNNLKKFIKFEKEIERFEFSHKEKIIGITFNKIEEKENKYMVGIFKDITNIKQYEYIKNRENKFAVLGELALSIAHEIRNPLNIIRGFSQLITESDDIDYIKSNADIVMQEADRLVNIASSLLKYGKEQNMKEEEIELVSFIEKLLFRLEIEDKVKLKTSSENLYIKGDKEKLIQVFLNIIKNALEAMENNEEKIFEIEISEKIKYMIISFRNNGEVKKGLELKSMFFPFFTTKSEGTGLGLAISKKIIEKHSGKIYAVRNKYSGLTFKIVFNRDSPFGS